MVPSSIKTILCDIEGTTTSISFVKDTLFPYALEHVESYLKDNWDEESTKTVVESLRKQSQDDIETKLDGAVAIPGTDENITDQIAAIVASVKWQMGNDRKSAPLKNIQGLIWAKGYKDGTIKGHVYEDVAKSFDQWNLTGAKIYIYSSGSVEAQKLLFSHTENGNILPKLSGHFDTLIGLKKEPDSYAKIIKELGAGASETLFLTDIVDEAKAAKAADLSVVLLDRPGNAALSDDDRAQFTVVSSFEGISLEVPSNKRKLDEEAVGTEDPPTKIAKTHDSTILTESTTVPPKIADDTETTEKKQDLQNGKQQPPNDVTEDMQVDVETDIKMENEKTEENATNKTSDIKEASVEAMQVDSANDIADTVDAVETKGVDATTSDEVKVKPSTGDKVVTAVAEDCKKFAPEVCDVAEAEANAEEPAAVEVTIAKDVVDEAAVIVLEKKLDTEEEDVDIKKGEPKVENGDDASASVLSNGTNSQTIETKSEPIEIKSDTIKTDTIETKIDAMETNSDAAVHNGTISSTDTEPEKPAEPPAVAEKVDDTVLVTTEKASLVGSEMKDVAGIVANDMTAIATIATHVEEKHVESTVDEKTADDVMEGVPCETATTTAIKTDVKEAAATEEETKRNEINADEQVVSKDLSTKDSTVTVDVVEAMDTETVAASPVISAEKPSDSTAILSNCDSMADDPKDVPIQVQHEVVSANEASTIDAETTAALVEDAATTHMSEVSEVVETISDNSKEKVSRVEITIEKIDKQLGQTTQTTTHIVKEISITEQKVCGKSSTASDDAKTETSTVATETSSTTATETKAEAVHEEKAHATSVVDSSSTAETSIAATIPEPKVNVERISHNGKCEASSNGIEKGENDSDKENEVETSNGGDEKLDSSALTAETAMKKSVEAAKPSTQAAVDA